MCGDSCAEAEAKLETGARAYGIPSNVLSPGFILVCRRKCQYTQFCLSLTLWQLILTLVRVWGQGFLSTQDP